MRSRPFVWKNSRCYSAAGFAICASGRASDTRVVKLPEPPEAPPSSAVPKPAVIMMIVILAGMALMALYANVQNWRRDKIETVIVTPVATPTATP